MQPRETGYEKGYPLGQNAGASDAALGNPATTQARSADSYGLYPPAYIDMGSYQTDTYSQNDWRNGFKQGWMDGYVKGYANVNVGPGPQCSDPRMAERRTGGADTGAKDEAKKEISYGKYILGALGVAGVIGIGYVLASDKYSKNPVDGPLEMPETSTCWTNTAVFRRGSLERSRATTRFGVQARF